MRAGCANGGWGGSMTLRGVFVVDPPGACTVMAVMVGLANSDLLSGCIRFFSCDERVAVTAGLSRGIMIRFPLIRLDTPRSTRAQPLVQPAVPSSHRSRVQLCPILIFLLLQHQREERKPTT